MTERITPEQIANVRRLNEGRTQGSWLVDGPSASVVAASGRIIAKVATFLRHGSYIATVEDDMNQAFLVAAANAIIPALDEIERLTAQNTHLLSLLWKIHINNKRGLPDGVREQIESLPYVPPYQPPAEEGVTP